MRTICDVCESAPASIFCAADEAALCRECDDKVHMCNKLASRHVRVGLADPSSVPQCDICENAPAFFYCEIDGSSLCLQCDMIVHVGGKRTHGRYLLLRQRVIFPGDNAVNGKNLATAAKDLAENTQEHKAVAGNHKVTVTAFDASNDGHGKMDSNLIDLNTRPARTHGQASNTQQMDLISDSNHDSVGVIRTRPFPSDAEK